MHRTDVKHIREAVEAAQRFAHDAAFDGCDASTSTSSHHRSRTSSSVPCRPNDTLYLPPTQFAEAFVRNTTASRWSPSSITRCELLGSLSSHRFVHFPRNFNYPARVTHAGLRTRAVSVRLRSSRHGSAKSLEGCECVASRFRAGRVPGSRAGSAQHRGHGLGPLASGA